MQGIRLSWWLMIDGPAWAGEALGGEGESSRARCSGGGGALEGTAGPGGREKQVARRGK